jgi:hypothetical protein
MLLTILDLIAIKIFGEERKLSALCSPNSFYPENKAIFTFDDYLLRNRSLILGP